MRNIKMWECVKIERPMGSHVDVIYGYSTQAVQKVPGGWQLFTIILDEVDVKIHKMGNYLDYKRDATTAVFIPDAQYVLEEQFPLSWEL